MKTTAAKPLAFTVLALLSGLVVVPPGWLQAQAPWPPPPPPPWPIGPQISIDAQRTARNEVRAQANWLQNSIRTASSYRTDPAGLIWQQFQIFSQAYGALKNTLTPQQLDYGANDLAELDAGLGILQEAFTNFQQDVAAGRSVNLALRDLSRVLSQATGVWMQEFNTVCARLRVGSF